MAWFLYGTEEKKELKLAPSGGGFGRIVKDGPLPATRLSDYTEEAAWEESQHSPMQVQHCER